MFSAFFNSVFYQPLYNGLIFLIEVVPFSDVGLAVIGLTIIVKLILFPLSRKATIAQQKMKEIEPEINKLKELHKNNRQKQAEEIMALYRVKKVSPFGGFLSTLLIQFPIIIALYLIFAGGGLPNIDLSLLYSFIVPPVSVNMEFLGILNIGAKSITLAILAGASQFAQAWLSTPSIPPKTSNKSSFKDDFARSMNLQVRYVLPVIIGFVAYTFSAAVALYWITNNLFGVAQELIIRRGRRKMIQ